MSKKITNGQNVDNFLKRKRLRIAMVIASILTIIFAVLSLSINLGIGYALVCFFISYILKRMYNNTPIKSSEKMKNIKKKDQEAIEKLKPKKKKKTTK